MSRHSPSPSSPATSKLSKFLQKRDRSKSASTSSRDSPSPDIAMSTPVPGTSKKKGSKFLALRKHDDADRRASTDSALSSPSDISDPPIIVDPRDVPRPRSRSDRPLSTISASASASSSHSNSKIGDLPTRLSGWFSHTFSTSSTDLSLPTLLAQHRIPETPSKRPNPLLAAAKHGKGHLDKAVRYLLDSDATPDKCTEPIWLLGVLHQGWEPPPEEEEQRKLSASTTSPPSSFRQTSMEYTAHPLSTSLSSSKQSLTAPREKEKDPSANWPPVFYADFTSRVWLTYRSHFATPIRDGRLSELPCGGSTSSASSVLGDIVGSPTTVKRAWGWGGEKTWSSDSGWGCMLRTGQSLLANALIFQQLGRDWRRPPHPLHTADYATYVQILTWFLDTPSPEAPFSVHRMALAGKELGTDVGQWFGPSTAAGAIRTLVNAFPECGLGVSVATDGTLYQSDVFAASYGDFGTRSPKKQTKWGRKPVLLLLGIRLGIDGVNPIYYDTIKQLYTFPQSVGIAGGRPSSSYYFMGSQADNLFYLDPHHARPAIPLRPPHTKSSDTSSDRDSTSTRNRTHRSASTSHSTRSYHPSSPSPLQHQFSTSSGSSYTSYSPRSPGTSEMDYRELGVVGDLDPVQEHYVTAYSPAELRTFHCERVRKMPLSGLDPSMLIGFLCRDEIDWWDFKRRVGELPRTIFSVQDEPPNWNGFDEDDVGLESMSDELDMEMGDEGEQFYDTRSRSGSPESRVRGKSEEIDTEEDPVDPVTPGPNSKFSFVQVPAGEKTKGKSKSKDEFDEEEFTRDDEDDDIEDDWVDPSVPPVLTPTPDAPYTSTSTSSASSAAAAPVPKPRKASKKGKKTKKQVPVPVPMVRIPSPPSQAYPFPVTPADESATPLDRSRTNSRSNTGGSSNTNSSGRDPTHRMHTARARDGGRTQSGGVKGILTDD